MTTPFDLNLRHLRGALSVHKLGSVSAAAAQINMSQSALTQGLAKLESQLGEVIFERRAGGMQLSDAGSVFLPRVSAAIGHLRNGVRATGASMADPERRLSMVQLRGFLALVESGSFVGATKAAGLSTTAIHRAVREIEQSLQKDLVERRGRGVQVNFVGKRLARGARLALRELQAGISELGSGTGDTIITVGTTPLTRAYLTPEAMAAMVAEGYPAGFRVFEGSWGELVELLREGVIDLIVGELPDHESPDLQKIGLYEESLVIAAGRQHPILNLDAPTLQDLAAYPWIVSPNESPLRAEWVRLFESIATPLSPIECGSIMIIGRLLTSSDLLTIATPDQVALQIRSGLLARVNAPRITGRYSVGITLRQGWRPTAPQKRFIEALTQVANSGRTNGHVASEWV